MLDDADEIYRVMYISKAVRPLTTGELDDLLAGATVRNRLHGISGILVYDGGAFLQILEGPTDKISVLVKNIQVDPRHEDVVFLSAGAVEQHYFNGWGMDRANVDRVDDTTHETLRTYMRNHHVGDRATVFRALILFCEEHQQGEAAPGARGR
jgi:hypothetical protein